MNEIQTIQDFQFMPREVNKAKGKTKIKRSLFEIATFQPPKDFDRPEEFEETPSKDKIMTEYLQNF